MGNQEEALKALQQVTEAVSEMEVEIQQLRAERCEAERTILRLESQYGVAVKDRDIARVERDAARREVCLEASTDASGCYISGGHILVAENRGWDCFKEEMACDTLSQEVSQDINLLKGLEQAKEGKFSENPPMITPKKKK